MSQRQAKAVLDARVTPGAGAPVGLIIHRSRHFGGGRARSNAATRIFEGIARVVAVVVDGHDHARKTQADFPHLTVLSDEARGLFAAAAVFHPHTAPDGGDADMPTTILVDRRGTEH